MNVETANWEIGMRVANRTQDAHLWEGTPWAKKLAIPRAGTVIEVPWATRHSGAGTVQVEWDSLSAGKADPAAWRMWIHTSMIEAR